METTREQFINQMLLSEILITAVIFTGVYFIFRGFWKKKEKEDDEHKKDLKD